MPLLYDVIDRTLSGKVSLDVCRTCFDMGCDVYTVFNGKTPIYRVMDYLATTPSANAEIGIEVLNLLLTQKKFDINRRYRSLPPPFSYLLSENYKFLGNKYSKDYLSTELIQILLSNGAVLNTYDENGASLLLFANSTENEYLQNYLVDHGININKVADNEGNNAVFSAIRDNNIPLLEKIVENYNVRLTTNTVKDWTSKVSSDMFDFLIRQCADNAESYEDLVEFRSHFSDKKDLVLMKYEKIAKIEVERANDYNSIMKCKKRYPDLPSITEPKYIEVATKEISQANDYNSIMICKSHYPDLMNITEPRFFEIANNDIISASNIEEIKVCEQRYQEFDTLIDSKKKSFYLSDAIKLDLSYAHAKNLVAHTSFSYDQEMYDIANNFKKHYQGYYDPDSKLPLAYLLLNFYYALSVIHYSHPSYHNLPYPGLFKSRYESYMTNLRSAYERFPKHGDLYSQEMLTIIDKCIQNADGFKKKCIQEYKAFCDNLQNNIKVKRHVRPSGEIMDRGILDTYHARENEGEIEIDLGIPNLYSRIYVYYNELYYNTSTLFSSGEMRFDHYSITNFLTTGVKLDLSEIMKSVSFSEKKYEYKSPGELENYIVKMIINYYYSFL